MSRYQCDSQHRWFLLVVTSVYGAPTMRLSRGELMFRCICGTVRSILPDIAKKKQLSGVIVNNVCLVHLLYSDMYALHVYPTHSE